MSISSFIPIQVVLYCLIVQSCQGQAVFDFPDASSNSSMPSLTPKILTSKPLRICNTEDQLSNQYCTCTKQVVSCDFSKYTVNTTKTDSLSINSSSSTTDDVNNPTEVHPFDPIELDLYGYQFPPNASRFCICNTPPTIHLAFSKDNFLQSINAIQRFDLFNLSGLTHFRGGFSRNFNGDLYIANVSIPEINGNEFARGNDQPIHKFQDEECCSPIKVDQNHKKPVIFIENTTIDIIRTRGLNDDHLWKTVILKSNTLNTVEWGGADFTSDSRGFDVAILNCSFKNVSYRAFLFRDATNLLMAKNVFDYKNGVNSYFLKSNSEIDNSNLILMDNVFWNDVYLDLYARQIVSWYNLFDLWDNVTFEATKNTTLLAKPFQVGDNPNKKVSGPTISLKYNVIDDPILNGNRLDFGNISRVILSENVFGTCKCSWFNLTKDEVVKPEINWCHVGKASKRNGKCSLRLDAVKEQCVKSHSVDFEQLCKDKEISVPKIPGVRADLTEDGTEMQINSSFISRIIEEYHFMFGSSRLIKLKNMLSGKVTEDTSGTSAETVDKRGISSSIPPSGVVLPVVITLIVIMIIVVLAFVLYKNKHRFLRSTGHHEILDSTNEMA